jgi:uncharacterized protein (TIGR00730 family)
MLSVSIFCSSSSRSPRPYLEASYNLGKLLAKENIAVYYGGGYIGEMGSLAKGVLDNSGMLIGVIPEFMMKNNWGNPEVSEMIVTSDLSERKSILLERADGIVALPGGTGTLDELLEALANKKLGLLDKPIIIYNIDGFFDPLLSLFSRMVKEELILPEHIKFLSIANSAEEVVGFLKSYIPMGKESIQNLSAL